MSRTDLDATTLANSLRMRAGDGSIEWVSEPIQASVLLDIADMLDENAKLRKLCARMFKDFLCCDYELRERAGRTFMAYTRYAPELRELGIEVES